MLARHLQLQAQPLTTAADVRAAALRAARTSVPWFPTVERRPRSSDEDHEEDQERAQ
jgi:hypothetical protein